MAGLMNKGRISTTYVNPVDKGGKGMALAVFCVWWLVYSREEIHKEYIRFGDQWIALLFKKYIYATYVNPIYIGGCKAPRYWCHFMCCVVVGCMVCLYCVVCGVL